jgi:hypothetical protein
MPSPLRDRIGRADLEHLQVPARTSNVEPAEAVKLSPSACLGRTATTPVPGLACSARRGSRRSRAPCASRHHGEPQLADTQGQFEAAEPGRAVAAERGEHRVTVRGEGAGARSRRTRAPRRRSPPRSSSLSCSPVGTGYPTSAVRFWPRHPAAPGLRSFRPDVARRIGAPPRAAPPDPGLLRLGKRSLFAGRLSHQSVLPYWLVSTRWLDL